MKRILLSAVPLLMAALAAHAQEPVLSEGFESGDVPPSGWTVRSCTDATSNKYKWESVAYGSDPLKYRGGYNQGGTKCMMVSSGKTTSTKPAPDSWLITPQISVAEGDNLSFMLAYAPVYNDNAVVPEDKRIKFAVLVSTTGTDAADFTETLMEIAPYGETDWRKKVLSLEKFAGKSIYIAFREYGDYDKGAITLNRTWIDDVTVDNTSSSDLVATELLSPVAGPKSTQTVSFSYTNSGMASTGMKASYRVNDGDVVTETLDAAASCAQGETLSYTFAAPATLNVGEENTVKVWMEAANDVVHENDTLAAKVSIDNIFTLPYEMNSNNLSKGWDYTYHTGNLNRGTNSGWWQVPDESFTKLVWTYTLCQKESILEGKWFQLPKGKLNVSFNYASGTEAPLTLVLTNCDTGDATETAVTLPASTEAANAKFSVSVPADALYKLGIKAGAEYAGPLSLNSLALAEAVPGDVAVTSVNLPSAIVANEGRAVKITVANYGEEAAADVPVKVTVDDVVVAADVIPSIESGKTLEWTLKDGDADLALSVAAGTHTVKVYTELEDDANTENDSTSVSLYAYDKPEMPFADSFEDADNNMRWTAENMSDNVLNWNIGTAVSNGVNWAKGDGTMAAYMASVAGAEHNAVLRSPIISVKSAGDVRLSYYYTTRMYATDAASKTYITAAVMGVSADVADFSVQRTDTVTDANVRHYRQGYLLCHLPAAGDYQISFLNTGMGHDIVLDDVRFDQQSDIAIVDAKQTAVSGFNNTVNTVSVKVANHGALPNGNITLRLTTTVDGLNPKVLTATIENDVLAGDTVSYSFDDVDISAAGKYVSVAELANTGDSDNFNDSWTLDAVSSYANATLPYAADFDTEEQQGEWTFGGTWQTGAYSASNSAYNGSGAISHHKKAVNADGDWAFSGCIEIPAGTYDMSFFYRTFLNGKTANLYAQNFALYLGKEPKAEAMTQTLYTSDADVLAYEKRYKRVNEKITVAEDGKYYIGVKCTSSTPYGVLYIDDIRIAANDEEPIQLTSYDADFSTWYHYDPSAQFSQWTADADGISTTQNIFNVGNPQTELPGLLVSPAFAIEQGSKVTATLSYSMSVGDAADISAEEKAKMLTAIYVAGDDSREAFTTVVASGNDVSGERKDVTGKYECPATGTYYFAVGVGGAANTTGNDGTLTYNIYSLNISAEVDGISTTETICGAAELYTAGGTSLGRFDSVASAMKACAGNGVYIIKTQSATVKVVR